MDPSSSMISQMTPAGYSPASFARSTDASVWPARTSTPPSRARSGNVCPGRRKSRGPDFGSISARIVFDRSCAEMPVVTRPRASTETENAVPSGAVLSLTMFGICSASSRSESIGTQIRPPPSLRMKLIASGVTFSAAITRSPSFSRSSSSMTTTILPSRMAAIAASIESIAFGSATAAPARPGSAADSARTVRYDGSRRPLRSSEIAASVNPDRWATCAADSPASAMAPCN